MGKLGEISAKARRGAAVPPVALKRVKLALQGGGTHGAYTWGVIDALLEDGRIEIEGLVGTSAGAMNATVTAYGLISGGPERARELLGEFWKRTAELGQSGPLHATPFDKLLSRGNMDYSAMSHFFSAMTRMFSPYELNPQNINPLRDLVAEMVDFQALRDAADRMKLFIAATNVLNGRLRVFETHEVSPDVLMASACLPFLFQAVEIDHEFYWDGGYSGNPPIFPLIYCGGTSDIVIVQIDPINIPDVPRTARAILDRVSTLSFNSSLMREMRTIKFVHDLLESEQLDSSKYPHILIHTIDAEAELSQFGASSKLNSDWEFFTYLHDLGQRKAKRFLQLHFDTIGVESTTDIREKFL